MVGGSLKKTRWDKMLKWYEVVLITAVIVLAVWLAPRSADIVQSIKFDNSTSFTVPDELEKKYYPEHNITCFYVRQTRSVLSIGGMSCIKGYEEGGQK